MSLGIDTDDVEYDPYAGKDGQTGGHRLFADDLGDVHSELNTASLSPCK
jgi:hypothetical protein